MSDTVLKQATGKELRKLLARLAGAIRETVGSLIAREVVAQPGELAITDAESILAQIPKAQAGIRGALDKNFTGKFVVVMFEVADACSMAGLLMMTPDEVIEERRARGALEGEDVEAFGEIGNVLCSGLGNVLRESVVGADVRLQSHATVQPGLDEKELLPQGPLVACRLKFKVGDQPESTATIVLDQETAEAWNCGPLADAPSVPEPATGATKAESGGLRIEDDLEDIPAAPIRGTLNSYLASSDCMPVLRRSCRRVGLDLRRHHRAEIPNPAAHRGEIVLLDVPPGEERRIDWCRRIKDFDKSTRVVLVLHRPSRALVAQAFLSHADVILGFPLDEPVLSQKLGGLLEPA